jgi:hypothetical protein
MKQRIVNEWKTYEEPKLDDNGNLISARKAETKVSVKK